MLVVVAEVVADSTRVRVNAYKHSWHGEWRAEGPPPLGSVDIELVVLGDLSWSASNSLTGGVIGGNALVGRVEDTDADGVVTLRVGDGILLVDVPDDGPLPRIGEELRLEDLALAFFPTGI